MELPELDDLVAAVPSDPLIESSLTDEAVVEAFAIVPLQSVQPGTAKPSDPPRDRVLESLEFFESTVWLKTGRARNETGRHLNSTFIGRVFARLGRFAIAMLAAVAFLVGGLASVWVTWRLVGRVYFTITFFAASACSVAVYLLFDRYGLLPDDPTDPPTSLGLGTR